MGESVLKNPADIYAAWRFINRRMLEKEKKEKKRKRIRYDLCAAFRRDATFSRAFSAQAIRLRGIT